MESGNNWNKSLYNIPVIIKGNLPGKKSQVVLNKEYYSPFSSQSLVWNILLSPGTSLLLDEVCLSLLVSLLQLFLGTICFMIVCFLKIVSIELCPLLKFTSFASGLMVYP